MKRFMLAILVIFALMLGTTISSAQETGGTVTIATSLEPDTLDIHKASGGGLLRYVGATLVTKHPETSEYVPYLAESWTTSEDGLTWDFVLRQGVTFHDGTDFTAQDYVYTFERWFAEETASPTASTYSLITNVSAVDDFTLRLELAAPFYPLLELLAQGFAQPLSQEAVEAAGDNYGQNPVGIGPFRFVEWVVGDRLVLESNSDYFWAPPFLHEGAPYIETLTIRFVPEYTTMLAGMETVEIDMVSGTSINSRDIPALVDAGFEVNTIYSPGMLPYVLMNVSQPPFDDILVRQAFNYAVDKEAMIGFLGGAAIPQYGPISVSVAGYWPGIDEIGYTFDLEKARELMVEAGYTYNDDGMLEKDGQPFAMTMILIPDVAPFAQMLQAMYAELGVTLELEQVDMGVLFGQVVSGQYQVGVGFYDFPEADVMYTFYHSSNLGGYNISQINDAALDEILDRTRNETDGTLRQQAVNEAQQYIVEQAFVVPLITMEEYIPVSNRIEGIVIAQDVTTWLNDVVIIDD
jgi:peptide/nickel transport system substrate-binding protein